MPDLLKINVYRAVARLYNRRFDYIPTSRIVEEVGGSYYRVYRALRQLEAEGVVQRKSRQSGWRPAVLMMCVYNTLQQLFRRAHTFIPTNAIAIHLNHNERHIRMELAPLERAGLIYRESPRGGWQPVRALPRQSARDKILAALKDLYRKFRQAVPTRLIAETLDITARHARRILSDLARRAQVKRPSPRAGWLPVHS